MSNWPNADFENVWHLSKIIFTYNELFLIAIIVFVENV